MKIMTVKEMETMVGKVVIEKTTDEEYVVQRVCDCWNGMGKSGKKGRIARCISLDGKRTKYLEAKEIM